MKNSRNNILVIGILTIVVSIIVGSLIVKKEIEKNNLYDFNVSNNCEGEGVPITYNYVEGDQFELNDLGYAWYHKDGMIGLKDVDGEFDAYLKSGFYKIDNPILIREPSSIRGQRSGFGTPNGEVPPVQGTIIQFENAGIRVGRPANYMNNGNDDRMSVAVIENLCLFSNPLLKKEKLGEGAAIWADMPTDQLTINNVIATCSEYGLLNTSYQDAFRIRAFHTGRVTFPLYFASVEEAGEYSASWFGTFSDCCFADGDGPVVLNSDNQPWNFSNVNIVR